MVAAACENRFRGEFMSDPIRSKAAPKYQTVEDVIAQLPSRAGR